MLRFPVKKVVFGSGVCFVLLLLFRVWTSPKSENAFRSFGLEKGPIRHMAELEVRPQSQPPDTLDDTQRVERRFQHRREVLQSACRLYGNSSLFKQFRPAAGFQPFPPYRPVMNKTVYFCGIAKAASTTWSSFFSAIKVFMKAQGVQASNDWAPQSDGEKVYFTFVREPYSRLLSAYVDKLLTPNTLFWRVTGRRTVQKFRADASERSKRCGHDVTFPEFVNYVIDSQRTGENRDAHFVPTHDHCHMCSHPYRYIGHLETIKQDMPYITEAIGSPIQYGRTYDKDTIVQNARMVFLKDRRALVQRCMDLDEASRRLWKKYQIRGIIHKHERFPYARGAAANITLAEFVDKALKAYEASKDKPERKAQRVESLREAFAQIPLEDRIQLQQTLFLDFQMFGFDPFLEDVFPSQPYQPNRKFSYFKIYD
ncbi:carbohydrate sulfotransferase 13-like [Littorina saxatilis]